MPARRNAREPSMMVLAAVVVLAACDGRDPVHWRDPNAIPMYGEHVTLYYDQGNLPCAGTLPFLSASVAALSAYLDVAPGDPIDYYYTQDLLPCPPNAMGCTVGPPAASLSCWGKNPNLVHELVHAVSWKKHSSNSFLEEGLAVSLGEFNSTGIAHAGATDQELLTPLQIPAEDFGLAGDFVSYLLTRSGPASFMKVLESVGPSDPVAAIESAFESTYGESMTALRADRAQSPLTFYANRIDLPECQAFAPDPGLGQGATVTTTVDCASNSVGVAGSSTTYLPFEVAADGIYALKFSSDSTVGFDLYACGGGAVVSRGDLGESSLAVGYFHAGRYAFAFGSAAASPQTISVALVPVLLGTRPPCSDLAPIAVPSGTQSVYLFSMDTGGLEVSFVLAEPATFTGIHPFINQTLNHVQVCTAACGDACTNGDGIILPTLTLTAGSTFSLKASFAGHSKVVGVILEHP